MPGKTGSRGPLGKKVSYRKVKNNLFRPSI